MTSPKPPTNDAFFLPGGDIGILLIHGWLGLPAELRPLGDFLAGRGYTVAGVLLAGHGGRPDELHTVRWQDWFASVMMLYQQLTQQCKKVVVIGYSLGGLLALHLAAHQPVDGVITLAAALTPAGGWPLRLLGVGRFVLPWLYPFRNADFSDPNIRGQLVEKMGQVDFNDPAVIAGLRSNIRISTRSIYEVLRLGRVVRRELPRVQQPTLVVQGRRDTTVLPVSAEHIHQLVGAADKQIAWFERSGHLLPNDVERKQVWEHITQWLEQHTHYHQSKQQPAEAKKQERSLERS